MSPTRNRTTTPSGRGLALPGWLALLLLTGCGAGPRPAPPPPCDPSCQDGVALLGVRNMMKFAYNIKISTQPVGAQDATTPCISFDGSEGGSVHIFGTATVDATQGASIVALTYDFENCLFSAPPDPTADQNFSITVTGSIAEQGTLAVQPTAATALLIQSGTLPVTMPTSDLSVSGTVYDPPVNYAVSGCALSVTQNGNNVSGSFCGRPAGFMF